MKKLYKVLFGLGVVFTSVTAANSAIPNTSHPTTFLGPFFRGGYTHYLVDNTSAFSVAAEVGPRNYRVGGTVASKICCNQRLKVSGEYLWQNINYAFFDGNSFRWVDQGALGATYEYDLLGIRYNPTLDVNAYVSRASNKNAGTDTISLANPADPTTPLIFTDFRRIAGGTAEGISPGVTIEPWRGGRAGIDLNYDNVNYDQSNPPNENAIGFGGTVRLSQAINNHFEVGALAGIRAPFNEYQANIAWKTSNAYGKWVVGLVGGYTAGKTTLPSTYNVGVSVNFLAECQTSCERREGINSFLSWTADPAVYLPQVLAITDDTVVQQLPPAPPPG